VPGIDTQLQAEDSEDRDHLVETRGSLSVLELMDQPHAHPGEQRKIVLA